MWFFNCENESLKALVNKPFASENDTALLLWFSLMGKLTEAVYSARNGPIHSSTSDPARPPSKGLQVIGEDLMRWKTHQTTQEKGLKETWWPLSQFLLSSLDGPEASLSRWNRKWGIIGIIRPTMSSFLTYLSLVEIKAKVCGVFDPFLPWVIRIIFQALCFPLFSLLLENSFNPSLYCQWGV